MPSSLTSKNLPALADAASDRPYVYEREDCLSLHFGWGATQSQMQCSDPFKLALGYTRVMMGSLFFVPAPKTILMIGLGGGSLAKYCHKYLPDADITVIEINPEVIALRDTFLIPPDSDRFRVICADGAQFVRTCATPFDVLMVDGFVHDCVPDALCSQDFYDACRSALAPDGVMVVNLDSNAANCSSVVARIGLSFDEALLVIPVAGNCNQAIFASTPSTLHTSQAQLTQRWNAMSLIHKATLSDSNVIKNKAAGRFGCALQEQLTQAYAALAETYP